MAAVPALAVQALAVPALTVQALASAERIGPNPADWGQVGVIGSRPASVTAWTMPRPWLAAVSLAPTEEERRTAPPPW